MSTTNSDHPRSRGEYAPRGLVRNSVGGSSPLSRGILPRSQPSRVAAGIIPALAGNTSARAAARPPTPDHPRSRGEYARERAALGVYEGSSPLSRGILYPHFYADLPSRIIPALAGNTRPWGGRYQHWWDHPRSRGEYRLGEGRTRRGRGSSPLSRGIRDRLASCYFLPRIIPALAGNTRLRRRRFPGWWDHPRSRGEYVWGLVQLGIQFGSSPLSRGIPGAQVRG